jgi:nucleotide-binding universal stress UspA family protein
MKIRRLLFATDFSDSSKDALTHATYLATELRADLGLVHVFERPFFVESGVSHRLQVRHDVDQWLRETKTDAQQRLEALAKDLRAQGLNVTTFFREGLPFVEILKVAEEIPADLIVIGTHGRTGLSHVLIGSVAERVVRGATSAVLTVRPARLAAGQKAGDA